MSDRLSPLVEPIGNGRFRVKADEANQVAHAVVEGRDVWVWLKGFAYLIQGEGTETRASAASEDIALAAPMPATVRSIAVTIGQQVGSGDVLVVLEAMKMELVIRATRDGVVSAVRCQEGELVQPGISLVELTALS